jgi:hypothetical protein
MIQTVLVAFGLLIWTILCFFAGACVTGWLDARAWERVTGKTYEEWRALNK